MLDTTWHYAVVVGIDQYPSIDGGKIDLQCPIQDAQRIEQWLKSPAGGNLAGRVKTLTRTFPPGRLPPAPVFDEINAAILSCAEEFVVTRRKALQSEHDRKAAWKSSRFYFYISGHGMDGDGDDAVLVTANATRTSMNHISTRNVLNRLRQDKVFAEIVVLADCCRELAGVTIQSLPWDLSGYIGYNDPQFPKTFVAYASRHRKRAFEPSPGSSVANSLFTQALIEGLEGGVKGSQVDSQSLQNFLYNYVPELAARHSRPDQNPEIRCDPGIVFVHKSKTYRVRFTVARGSAFVATTAVDAIEIDGKAIKSRVTLQASAPGVFEGSLPTGYYIAAPEGADPFKGSPPIVAFSVLGEDRDVALN